MHLRIITLVTTAAVLLGGAAPPGAAPTTVAPAYVDVPGAHIVSSTQVSDRTVALTIETPSFPQPTAVEVTLPTGYDPSRPWPVTYYLAGTGHSETSFRAQYGGETLTASYPSIIVSPDGDSGYWSDWYNYGAGGFPQYETFVTAQLIPLIDANFRTIANRSYRAILGESMGGYGTMMMAARHPDLFVAAASLSGVTDSNNIAGGAVISLSPLLQAQTLLPDTINGPRLTQEVRWRGHNPVDLASNLRDMSLQVRTGNGAFSASHGEMLAESGGCALEGPIIRPESFSFHSALTQLGISHAWQDYAWGCHSVALFMQEITDTLPGILAAFGTPAPATFDYRSIDPSFSIYGWSVRTDARRAAEFIALSAVSANGITAAGSGSTTITSPPLFAPDQHVAVVIGSTTKLIIANADGRITFAVDLGSPNLGQQYRIGTPAVVRSVQVRW